MRRRLQFIDIDVACPRYPSTGTMPALRPRGLIENKPATSAITFLRDDEVTERCHGYQKYFFSLTLDTAPKPYYFGSKNPNVSAVFTTALLDLASVRSTRATAANHRQLISVCRRDELGVANSNVISEVMGQACPRLPRLPRRAVGLAVERPARATAKSRVRSVRPLD